jgi:uncharacterized protein (DUF488 family)
MCSAKSKKHIVFTIGHSTRTLADFISILKEFNIKKVIDVRTIPKSRHNPQFNKEHLKKALHKKGISYTQMPDLGGLRHTTKDSINTGWHNSSFRGFADYMQTEQFHTAIEKLGKLAQKKPLVIMCAEAVPWRCHRSLIGDALLVRHYDVEDIYNHGTIKPHTLTSFARVRGKHITYPPDNA